MAKECLKEGCDNPVFSNGYCRYDQHLRTDDKWLRALEKKKLKGRDKQTARAVKRNSYIIPKQSAKMIARNAQYRPIRDKYLRENPVCEVHDCENPSTNPHHKMGRDINTFADDWARENDIPLLCDERYLMACCTPCHPKRIHENSEWAYEHGYLISKA